MAIYLLFAKDKLGLEWPEYLVGTSMGEWSLQTQQPSATTSCEWMDRFSSWTSEVRALEIMSI